MYEVCNMGVIMLRTILMNTIEFLYAKINKTDRSTMWLVCVVDKSPYLWYGVKGKTNATESWYKMTDDMWVAFKAGRVITDKHIPPEEVLRCAKNCDECC